METEDIDFEILQVLTQAPTKKYLRKILEYCFLIRNKLQSFENYYQTRVASDFPEDLKLTESQSHQLLISLVKLIERSVQYNFEDIDKIFPKQFDQALKDQLIEQIVSNKQQWSESINQKICQADRLVDIDWRIDIQLSSNSNPKSNEPIVFLQLETLGAQNNESKNLNFQMNAQEISGFHSNLKKIKDQLNALSQDQ